MKRIVLAVALSLVSLSAFASSYVLSASKWGSQQNAAVANAGGTVQFSNNDAGLAVATSDNPGFLALVSASNAIQSAELDAVRQWQGPMTTFDVSLIQFPQWPGAFYPTAPLNLSINAGWIIRASLYGRRLKGVPA